VDEAQARGIEMCDVLVERKPLVDPPWEDGSANVDRPGRQVLSRDPGEFPMCAIIGTLLSRRLRLRDTCIAEFS